MAKKSQTLRDFTQGLNTESSPRDVDDSNLTRSVGVTIERPGILRPLGKANSSSGGGQYYKFYDDNSNEVVTDALQEPGHGLYAFAYSFNYGERTSIIGVVSTSSGSDSNGVTYVTVSDDIGTGNSEVNFVSGDIVRIYSKTTSMELNNRYFEVSTVDSANKRVYLKTIKDGTAKEFSLKDEAGNRVAAAIIDTGATNGSDNLTVGEPHVGTAGRSLFAAGDYIKMDDEVMLVTNVKVETSSNALAIERGALDTDDATHDEDKEIYKYTYGPDHADLTAGTEDGYIEIVPQRNYTKYIASQNGETINLYSNDTTNSRSSLTKWHNSVIDLKNDFKGKGSLSSHTTSEIGAALGLDTLNTNDDWPQEGLMPNILFANSNLRVSPTNKIGKDDTNYSPRWLGHIKREALFEGDNSSSYINEWYLDTMGVKRPSKQGGYWITDEAEQFKLGTQIDRAKVIQSGMPWGNNWFSQFYLTGHLYEREVPAIARFQECDFWENESGLTDKDDDVIETEVSNSTFSYEISDGHDDTQGNFGRMWTWADSDGTTEYWKIRQNLFHRNLTKKITTIKAGDEDGFGNAIGTSTYRKIPVNHPEYFAAGQYIRMDQEIILVHDIDKTNDMIHVRRGQEGSTRTNPGDSESIYNASKCNYTRPSACSDLLINNSGEGQGGAYTFGAGLVGQDTNNLHGKIPWVGLNTNVKDFGGDKKVVQFVYSSGTGTAAGVTTTGTYNGDVTTIESKDESLESSHWIYYRSAKQNDDENLLKHYSVMKNVIEPSQDYYVTYTCRNFHVSNSGTGKLRMTIGCENSTDLTSTQYHDIDSNAYKTTVEITAPDEINWLDSNLVLCITPTGADDETVGGNSNSTRTMIGDLSVIPKTRNWMQQKTYLATNYFELDSTATTLTQHDSWRGYAYPLSGLSIGYQKFFVSVGDNWGINSSSYDFYVTCLYDGGQTPQESAPRYVKTISMEKNNGLRLSASLCYSSIGDVYDMFNKRITGTRVYYRSSDSQQTDKLYALLDIDFARGVRKSSNANFVKWAPDYQVRAEKATDSSTGSYSLVSNNSFTRPYKQVKPADESSHEFGYFRFDAPPTVLEYSALNSSQPFERGDFFAQYKTIALLKGKAYIGNFSIRPTGLTNLNSESKSFEYYSNAVIQSEEGCYDKFPFESGWVFMPSESDDSPIVKLESFKDFLVIHKVNSTHILNFKKEDDPELVVNLKANGIKWKCQSITTSIGAIWVNQYGCFHFDGEKLKDLTDKKISKNSLGWPQNDTSMFYWDIKASDKNIPSLAFDDVNNQLLVVNNSRLTEYKDLSTDIQKDSTIWIYDFGTQSWTSDICSPANSSRHFLNPLNQVLPGFRTNFITDSGNNTIFVDNRYGGGIDGNSYPIRTWENKLWVDTSGSTTIYDTRHIEFMTKELDFGNPHTLKRIYQVFVTYRMSTGDAQGDGGDIDTGIEYAKDGGTFSGAFDKTGASDNYGSSFDNTNGEWAVATLVPSSSIDCYTFQLKLTSGSEGVVPYDFEINDITFVYRLRSIKTKVKA